MLIVPLRLRHRQRRKDDNNLCSPGNVWPDFRVNLSHYIFQGHNNGDSESPCLNSEFTQILCYSYLFKGGICVTTTRLLGIPITTIASHSFPGLTATLIVTNYFFDYYITLFSNSVANILYVELISEISSVVLTYVLFCFLCIGIIIILIQWKGIPGALFLDSRSFVLLFIGY